MSSAGRSGPARLTVSMALLLAATTAGPGGKPALVERLAQTRATNLEAILDAQFRPAQQSALSGFRVSDPYHAGAAETVERWYGSEKRSGEVCAVYFPDRHALSYELRTFPDTDAARAAGFTVTHEGRCGSCSTLRDLAVYLRTTDLTTPARRCARKWGAWRVRACFIERIGLTPFCAESWAYTALHTRSACRGACVQTYGLLNLLLHRYPAPNNTPDGGLNACLHCDETQSGPGFRYSAGRTRRNSGIESAIERRPGEVYPLDHRAYFSPVTPGDSSSAALPALRPEAE